MMDEAATSVDVLVVEDDPDLNEMIGAYVTLAGFAYHGAHTGAEALRATRARAPGMVLLDLMLPDLDGFELYRRLRDEDAMRGVPVVVVSALCDQASRTRAQSLGARGFLAKPFDPDELMTLIREVMVARSAP